MGRLRGRLARLLKEAGKGAVLLETKDGATRAFSEQRVLCEMFLAQCDLIKGQSPEDSSGVIAAVLAATPQSRERFEERFGVVVGMEVRIVASQEQGGWAGRTPYSRTARWRSSTTKARRPSASGRKPAKATPGTALSPRVWGPLCPPNEKPAALEGGLETPSATSFYPRTSPPAAHPLRKPRRGKVRSPQLFNNIAKHGPQDEPFLRCATLKLYRILRPIGPS